MKSDKINKPFEEITLCLCCLRWPDVLGLFLHVHTVAVASPGKHQVSRRRGEREPTSLVGNCFPQETSVMETEALSTKRLVSLGL